MTDREAIERFEKWHHRGVDEEDPEVFNRVLELARQTVALKELTETPVSTPVVQGRAR